MFRKIIFEKNGRNENFGFLPDFGEKSYFSKNTNRYNVIHKISNNFVTITTNNVLMAQNFRIGLILDTETQDPHSLPKFENFHFFENI